MYLLSILIHPGVFLPIGKLMRMPNVFFAMGNMGVQMVENRWKIENCCSVGAF